MKESKFKTIIGENNKITKIISFLFLILIMFGLFAFILIGLYRFDLIDFPDFIKNIFFKTDSDVYESEKDDGNIYDYLHNNNNTGENSHNDGGYTLKITLDNIKQIIAGTKLPDNLYLETIADYYNSNGKISRTEEMSLYKKDGKYKYDLSVNSVKEESYINNAKNEFIENFKTGSKLKKPVTEAFSFDNIPHISNINYYLNLIESGEIVNCSIYQNSDSNTVEIKYSIPQLDQRELIYISLDTGIVEWVRCYTGEHNDLFYECKTAVKEAYYDGDEQAEANTSIHEDMFFIK
ncbi:MAG: hypothetical protein FWF82_03875 [Oscillospiraceae bacterium]|nr:hypothetical protein [Oscillospiraceae bacterium]